MPPADSMTCTLDFALDGKQFGDIELLFSDNKHAFSKIPIPIVCIKNGSGPTLLLTAGNHGDEYEGQVILRRLIHATSPQEINGRLIILPALNYPAVLDDARVSPLDGGNLNRSFPGDAAAGPTAAIAEYVTEHLLPLCDAGIDLHSGGSNAWYLPSAFLCTAADPAMTRANLALAEAFAAPYTLVVRGAGAPTGFDPVANARGVPFISCELGGDGRVDPHTAAIGIRGVQGVLQHLQIIEPNAGEEPKATQFLNGISGSHYLSAPFTGIFEPLCFPGEQVKPGQVAGRLYSVEEVERQPLELTFEHAGVVLVRGSHARVKRGSHLFLVATGMNRDDVLAVD